nr:MAG TPA: hypothetical protein [Caudoviricetes sp.]
MYEICFLIIESIKYIKWNPVISTYLNCIKSTLIEWE